MEKYDLDIIKYLLKGVLIKENNQKFENIYIEIVEIKPSMLRDVLVINYKLISRLSQFWTKIVGNGYEEISIGEYKQRLRDKRLNKILEDGRV